MPANPTVSELIVECFGDGGFRAEHALAVAMADASPKLKAACVDAMSFLKGLPQSSERGSLLAKLDAAVTFASTPAARNAS